jgi:hypothetical protein
MPSFYGPYISSEATMWKDEPKVQEATLFDSDIEEKYASRADRIVTETNREKLRNFADALKRPGYMDTRPFYQRRNRWDPRRQSQLIESILINIPIPPLFVYETQPDKYEVMDGQQRITAIRSFYSNELVLKGLERWPELNGRTYSKLPDTIKAGIDRRSISWVTVLNESSRDEEEAFQLKQLVFERLNTGGVKLSAQEIRNALYASDFNQMLLELSRMQIHREAWGLPQFEKSEDAQTPEYLLKDRMYSEMGDVEVILRFFALRHAGRYKNGMRSFLDSYMFRARKFSSDELVVLKDTYLQVLALAMDIFEEKIFRSYDSKTDTWKKGQQKALADAVLVALTDFISSPKALVNHKDQIVEKLRLAFETDSERELLTGRGNTKADVENRINLMHNIFSQFG